MPTLGYLSEEITQSSGLLHTPLSTRQSRGRIRVVTGFFKNTTGSTIAIDSWIGLCDVPAGYILPTSRIYWSAFGATATLEIGYDSYRDNNTGLIVPEDTDFFRSALDVAAASSVDFGTFRRKGYEFNGEWRLICQNQTVAIPTDAEIHACLHVVID
jgi:hypothetical protein